MLVATVSSNGLVTAKAAGTARITVKTADGGKTAVSTITVDDHGDARSTATTFSLNNVIRGNLSYFGDNDYFKFTTSKYGYYKFYIESDELTNLKANLRSDYAIFAQGDNSNGSKQFIAASYLTPNQNFYLQVFHNLNNRTGTYRFWGELTPDVTGVQIHSNGKAMKVGQTQQLSATITPSNAGDKNLTWKSQNPSIASVSSTGVVTARKSGQTVISVSGANGTKTSACSVVVE